LLKRRETHRGNFELHQIELADNLGLGVANLAAVALDGNLGRSRVPVIGDEKPVITGKEAPTSLVELYALVGVARGISAPLAIA
jgi:hypothetical protein